MADYLTDKKLTITQWAEDDRPREKLLLKGRSALSDAELIAILIGSGTANESAVDVAKRILMAADGDLNKLSGLTVKDLCTVKGIGEAKAISIIAALELGRRRNQTETPLPPQITASKHIYDYMKPELLDLPVEQFWVLMLNQNLRPIKKVKVGEGGVAGVVADPKIVFHKALECLASNIVLVHNHPSGNLIPSKEDNAITNRIVQSGVLLQINVVDHLIFTNNGYYSYKEAGLI